MNAHADTDPALDTTRLWIQSDFGSTLTHGEANAVHQIKENHNTPVFDALGTTSCAVDESASGLVEQCSHKTAVCCADSEVWGGLMGSVLLLLIFQVSRPPQVQCRCTAALSPGEPDGILTCTCTCTYACTWACARTCTSARAHATISQVNITWLTKITSALSVGVVGGFKVVPQWASAAIYDHTPFHGTRIASACLNLSGALLWTYSEAREGKKKEDLLSEVPSLPHHATQALALDPCQSFGNIDRADLPPPQRSSGGNRIEVSPALVNEA